MGRSLIFLTAAICFVILSGGAVFAQNYKIKQTMSVNGQEMTNTTYVRGPRKRTESGGIMGMGGDVANIEQCDLKQNVHVNDKKKLYPVDPFDTGDATPTTRTAAPKTKTPTTRGGTVTYTSNITDTGERKQMFGVTARHLKTSTSMESSPDACSKTNMTIQSDGWYIDLPEFSCPMNLSSSMPAYGGQGGGCQDRMIMKNTGGGKLGFPLTETRTMNMEGTSFTSSTETVEFTKAPLEATLFDIPTGYTLAGNSQALYGTPDYSAMMNSGNDNAPAPRGSSMGGTQRGSSSAPQANFSGVKIGVVLPNNRGDSVSTSGLQSFLIERLRSDSVMAIAVASEADAKTMGLDYVLTTDITKLKQSTGGKIGGMFGKVTGAPTSGAFDAQVDYRLTKISDGKVALQSKSASKSETEANAAAQNLLGMEATAVLGAIK